MDDFGHPRDPSEQAVSSSSSASSFSPPPSTDPFWELKYRVYDPPDDFSEISSYVPSEEDDDESLESR